MKFSIKQGQLIVITFRPFLYNYIMKLKIKYYLIIFPMNLKGNAMRDYRCLGAGKTTLVKINTKLLFQKSL